MLLSNFTAELHCQYGRVGAVETPLHAHPIFSADQDGWLCTEDMRITTEAFKPLFFEFVFIEKNDDRIHYRINCVDSWEYSGAKLEQNNNGWLGLYGTHVVGRIIDALNPANLIPPLQKQWKIETLEAWDGQKQSAEHVEFYLRDTQGYRVSQVRAVYTREKLRYHYWFLHAGEKDGEILKFHLRNIKTH